MKKAKKAEHRNRIHDIAIGKLTPEFQNFADLRIDGFNGPAPYDDLVWIGENRFLTVSSSGVSDSTSDLNPKR